jgi:hypothetical protein
LGENPIAPPPSEPAPARVNLLHAILQAYSPMKRFGIYKIMFQRYPWRQLISKSDHFESTCYLFAHECYIFEERLKVLFDALACFAQHKGIDVDVRQTSRAVMKLHKSAFANALKLRGVHVHQEDFVPREIKRIGLLRSMLMAEEMFNNEAAFNWRWLETQAVSRARKQWIRNCDEAERAVRTILLAAFRPTKAIWSQLAG